MNLTNCKINLINVTNFLLLFIATSYAQMLSITIKLENQLPFDKAQEACMNEQKALPIVKTVEDLERIKEAENEKENKLDHWIGFGYNNINDRFEKIKDRGKVDDTKIMIWDENEPRKNPVDVCVVLGTNRKLKLKSCAELHYIICQNKTKNGECDNNQLYFKYGEMCYKNLKKQTSAKGGSDECTKEGAELLLTFEDQYIDDILNEIFTSQYDIGIWTQLRKNQLGTWMYGDGTVISSDSEIWATGFPDKQNCSIYSLRFDRKLISYPCNSVAYPACGSKNNSSENKSFKFKS